MFTPNFFIADRRTLYVYARNEQWTDGPDLTTNNVVSGNTMTPNGNECVDIKEGAYGNIVENNECREQLDEKSGCYSSRGDDNIFRCRTGVDRGYPPCGTKKSKRAL